jgi:CRP/FNR family cyclic AMP-dependent transcriptional regulator
MLGKNAKVDLLKRAPLFAGCSKKELTEIARIADEIDFAAGDTLIRENTHGRQFFVLIEGTVRISKKGKAIPIRGGAEFFGEIALLSDVPTTATVTATSPVRALVVVDHRFRELLETSPGIQLKVLKSLAERLAPDTL